MLTEISAAAAEFIQTESHVVDEAAKTSIEQVHHITECNAIKLKFDHQVIIKLDLLHIKKLTTASRNELHRIIKSNEIKRS